MRWSRKNDETVYTFSVPANTTASLRLPDGQCAELCAGAHRFSQKTAISQE